MKASPWPGDLDGKDETVMAHRRMLIWLCSERGFRTSRTNGASIRQRPENPFTARIGERVSSDPVKRFRRIRMGPDPDP